MTAALEGDEWSAARPGSTLPPGKTRNPFYRRLGGPQGRSGRVENLVPTGIRSRTIQPVDSRYTDGATRPLSLGGVLSINCPLKGWEQRELHLNIHSVPRSKHFPRRLWKKRSQLMLYREIIVVCSEIHTEHTNTLCGQNLEFLNVKPDRAYSKRLMLKV